MTNDEYRKANLNLGARVRRRDGSRKEGVLVESKHSFDRKAGRPDILHDDGTRTRWQSYCPWDLDHTDPVHGIEKVEPKPQTNGDLLKTLTVPGTLIQAKWGRMQYTLFADGTWKYLDDGEELTSVSLTKSHWLDFDAAGPLGIEVLHIPAVEPKKRPFNDGERWRDWDGDEFVVANATDYSFDAIYGPEAGTFRFGQDDADCTKLSDAPGKPFAFEPKTEKAEEEAALSRKYDRKITVRTCIGSATGWIDVYDVLKAFGVTCPARQHAAKKILCAGIRGGKDETTDLREAYDALERAMEMAGGAA